MLRQTGLRLAAALAGGLAGGLAGALAGPAGAQGFTSAAEVRPILEATRASWIAVREYEGRDLVYFTHLVAWRCGLSEVRFTINDASQIYVWPLEPCYEGTAQPNAIRDEAFLPYVELPLGAAQTIAVVMTLDDGTVLSGGFARPAVLMP
jgi:hypothetical protein